MGELLVCEITNQQSTKFHTMNAVICKFTISILSTYLSFTARPKWKMWTVPEELVAATKSGSCGDGPNDKENIVDE